MPCRNRTVILEVFIIYTSGLAEPPAALIRGFPATTKIFPILKSILFESLNEVARKNETSGWNIFEYDDAGS